MKFKTAFLCGMLLQGVDSYIQGLRRVPLSGPLQTLGPSTSQYADLSFNECGIECTLDSNCTGISYNPGSPIDGAESKCWTGRFHPFYVAEQGDVDHSHPFWAAYSQTEICEAPDSIMKNEGKNYIPVGASI